MSDRTRISWATATWNPIAGCTPIGVGCAHCYAARMAQRLKFMGRPLYQDVVADGRVSRETQEWPRWARVQEWPEVRK